MEETITEYEGYVGPIIDSIIDTIQIELKKKEIRNTIMEKIIDPLVKDMASRYYPYFMLMIIILIIVVMLLITILALTIYSKNSKDK